ncbi:MAG: VOC family protein [Lautropia sp.]|nr:VOC family protein [Lautropia sp.]
MSTQTFVSPDEIRTRFSSAMSKMYRAEVPQYGTLLDLVADINAAYLKDHPDVEQALRETDELDRLDVERHGAIRLGLPRELSNARQVFGVMGMQPVGYYDLSVAGVPVHSTAFRPVGDEALRRNPFRVFTSLLRLELIADEGLREQAARILEKREIFTPRALALVKVAEQQGGLDEAQADEFVAEVLETFRWHSDATVDAGTYQRLHDAHRLIADVVSFKGPHINHLTPRTLDIDAVQAEMPRRGITAKDVVEGPPTRRNPILLRQTSFKALEEPVRFVGDDKAGTHTARFGEIEQRGMALTRKGRALYDQLLANVREIGNVGNSSPDYQSRLEAVFVDFPDDLDEIRRQELAFFRYVVRDEAALQRAAAAGLPWDTERLIQEGAIAAHPIVYEDFLPVSAAGIFQSNLGGTEQKSYAANAAQAVFEEALQAKVLDEIALYQQAEADSLAAIQSRYQRQAA